MTATATHESYEDMLHTLSEGSVHQHFDPFVDIDWDSPEFAVEKDDPRWVLPVSESVLELAAQHKLVVTCEDNGVNGGVGSAVSAALRRAEIDVPCRDVGLPQRFYEHASRGELLSDLALTEQDVARRITGWVAALGSGATEAEIREHLD